MDVTRSFHFQPHLAEAHLGDEEKLHAHLLETPKLYWDMKF